MTPRNTLQRLSAARTALILDHPFFGALALRLTPVESKRTKTMSTDGTSLFYSPEYIETLTDAQLVGIYAHEVMHPAMNHHTRRAHRDPKLWNKAADYAINPVLTEAGFTLPDGALDDPRYAGQSAEAIYSQLSQEQEQDEPQSGAGDDSEGEGEPDPLADVPGAILDAPAGTESESEADWQVATTQAAQVARMMGTLPSGLAQAVAGAVRAKADPWAILRRFVQQTASADYSWKRPNRRYISQGIYLPELRSETMPPLVLIIDSSGSTRSWQEMFCGEIAALAEEYQPERVYVIHADAAVHQMDVFERGERVEIGQVMGQGGTDFRPAFDHIDAEQIQPACAIYLTDGEGSYPEHSPDYPVLWAMTTDHAAPWGETVRLEP